MIQVIFFSGGGGGGKIYTASLVYTVTVEGNSYTVEQELE